MLYCVFKIYQKFAYNINLSKEKFNIKIFVETIRSYMFSFKKTIIELIAFFFSFEIYSFTNEVVNEVMFSIR